MTFSELCTAVVLALATDYTGTGSERTRDVPDARTIRYYTTLGLLDRPASFRGRTALYNRKHLLQLVAIKRLQARGLTLTQVQAKLVGMSPAHLEQLASVPKEIAASEATPSKKAASQRSQSFWKQPVAEPTEAVPAVSPAPTLLGVPLTSEVTLLLPALRQLDAHDLEGLQGAAQPLLRWLRLRRILDDSTD